MDHKEYLREFIKGPCSPVVVTHGIMGGKLTIEIDCEELKEHSSAAFKTCGWDSCTKTFFFIGIIPDKRYKIWIPEVLSPMTLANPLVDQYQKCFAALAGLNIERKSGQLQANPPRGVTIYPEGDSADQARQTECGWSAMTDLLPADSKLQPRKLKQFGVLGQALKDDGYIMGLTAQALPYDWRLSIKENQFQAKFVKMLELMNDITGKKVSIIAHSFGNINFLYNVWKMDETKKKNLIQRYFALGPPFLGAPQLIKMLIGGSTAYFMAGRNFKKAIGSYPGAFDLMPRNTFRINQKEPWMTSILNRAAKEDKSDKKVQALKPEDDIVSKIFPGADETCFKNDWKARSKKCLSGLYNFQTFGSVNGEEMRSDNLEEIFSKYSYNSQAGEMYRQSRSEQFDKMPNPGVQTTIIYSNLIETAAEFHYISNPKLVSASQNTNYIDPNVIQQAIGDATVLTPSSIIPGIKWAYEFEKKQAGANPVVFVEVCSTQNRKAELYQGRDSAGAPTVTKNEYQGIDCECKSKDCFGNIDHLGIVSEVHIVRYLLDSLQDRQTPRPKTRFESASAATVNTFVQSCGLLLQ
jgi:Lecithin:cholesterol acyltransferase